MACVEPLFNSLIYFYYSLFKLFFNGYISLYMLFDVKRLYKM